MKLEEIVKKNNWKLKKISDVTFYQEGPGVRKIQYTEEGVKLLNVGNIQKGKIDLTLTDRYISEEEAYGRYKHFLADEGDLIIACSGIQVSYFHEKIAFLKNEHLPLCMNTSTMRFKSLDEEFLDINYFSYFLKTNYFKRQLQRLITGSAQLNFGPSHIEQIDMMIPPIEVQKQIVEVLEEAKNLIDKRKEQIKLLDDLIESIFYEMFGDPVKNDKGWEVTKLGKVTKFIDYRGKTPQIQNNGILLITAKNIGKKHFREEPVEYISRDLYKERMTRGFPKANDVLFVTEGATMGFVCRVPRDIKQFSVGQRLITLVCKNELKEEFLHYFIYDRMFQGEVSRKSTGSSAKGIRASELKKIEILIPPIQLQNQFAEKVQLIESQKTLMEESLKLMEDNYNNLMQRAFKGELF